MKRKDFPHAVNAGTAKEEENDGTAEEGDKTGVYGLFTAILRLLLAIANAAINFFKTWIWKSDDVKQKVVPEKKATRPCDIKESCKKNPGNEWDDVKQKVVPEKKATRPCDIKESCKKNPGNEWDDVKQKEVREEKATRPCDIKESCKKNPGHEDFIRVNHFDFRKHLPKAYQDELYDLYIRSVIGLTVHIIRTEGELKHLGSGMVCNVDKRFDKVDKSLCPCKICDRLRPNYGRYEIRTAEHIVPTDEQSLEDTTVYLNYNNGKPLSSCEKLYASRIKASSKQQDCCSVLCVSHDQTLCKEIEKRLREYDSHYDRLVQKTKKKKRGGKKLPVICVSHPHGKSKCITIGEMQCVKKGQPEAWRYTTATCSGCSGAPVFILGEKMQGKYPYHISVHTRGGLRYNTSATSDG